MTEQETFKDIGPSAEEQFEPTRLLKQLEEAWKPVEDELPDRLPISELEVMLPLFQPREMSEKHVEDLRKAIGNVKLLDAMLVLPVGGRRIIIDGHHRMQAYFRSATTEPVPVAYFRGTPHDAVLEAGRCNSKAKLPMDNQQRQNYAWKLVLVGGGSKAEICEASGVSLSQVAIMRRARKSLGDDAFSYSSWWKAQQFFSGTVGALNQDDVDAWKEELAAKWADRLAKSFSTTMAKHPEVAAIALSHYFGRKLPLVVAELQSFVSNDLDGLYERSDESPDF